MRYRTYDVVLRSSAFLHPTPPKTWGRAKQNIVRQWTRLSLATRD